MAQLPAHASPALPPSTAPQPSRALSDYQLPSQTTPSPSETPSDSANHRHALSTSGKAVPSFISPAITPPATPGDTADLRASVPSHPTARPAGTQTPDLVEALPEVECIVRARIPTTSCHELFLHVYHNNVDNKEHLAIVFGNHIRSRSLDAPRPGETEMDRMIRGAYDGRLFPGRTTSRVDQLRREAGVSASATADDQPPRQEPPLVRIHSECYTGETVWSARCDCGEQLDEAARQMSAPESGGGVIIYLRQEGRGIGLGEKLKAYNLQDLGNDTYEANLLLRHPADARSYGLATAMLVDLGLGGPDGIRLLTNNPDKVRAVEGPRREVVVHERVPMVPLSWTSEGKSGVHGPELEKYLSTKIEKFKHMLG